MKLLCGQMHILAGAVHWWMTSRIIISGRWSCTFLSRLYNIMHCRCEIWLNAALPVVWISPAIIKADCSLSSELSWPASAAKITNVAHKWSFCFLVSSVSRFSQNKTPLWPVWWPQILIQRKGDHGSAFNSRLGLNSFPSGHEHKHVRMWGRHLIFHTFLNFLLSLNEIRCDCGQTDRTMIGQLAWWSYHQSDLNDCMHFL